MNDESQGHAGTSPEHPLPSAKAAPTQDLSRVIATLPTREDIANLADVFSLLGEPTRVRLLIALLSGPLRVRDLAKIIGLSESATSHALRLLRAHRVVDVHRDGRAALYDLSDDHVRTLLELGLQHVDHTILIHPAPALGGSADPGTCSGASPHDGTVGRKV